MESICLLCESREWKVDTINLLKKVLMKNTAFTKFHKEAGAKMVPFAGYNMPVEYVGINEEHVTVRETSRSL